MKTSSEGIALIKRFEGFRTNAYKAIPSEEYWTIGYGHYGPDVKPDMVISQTYGEALLKNDLEKYEGYVNALNLVLTQSQFDALVSFAYNCGKGNLQKLVKGRSVSEIGNAILLYNKAGGRVLPGLQKRREAERELFFKDAQFRILHFGDKGEDVKNVRFKLNQRGYVIPINEEFDEVMRNAVIEFQGYSGLVKDGIVGPKTYKALGMM